MKKIISMFLATIMIISCFASIPMTAQAATVTQTVKSFADMEDKISSKTIQPVLSESNEKYESFSYQYNFTVDTAGYYMIMTSALSNGIQYSATGSIMNAKVDLDICSSDLTKEYFEKAGYFNSPNGSLYSRLYLEKGNYTVIISRDQSTIYPAQTTNLYIAKLQSGISPVKISYIGGGQTIKLKINSIDTLKDILINNSNGNRNPYYSWMENVGEKFYLDSNSCVSIKLEDNQYAWLQIGVKDVYGIESVFEYQILNNYTANISGITNKTYTGSAIKQSGLTVKAGYDIASYACSYKNNTNVGTAQMIITGTGNTLGSVTKTFRVNPKGTSISKITAAKKGFKVYWKKQSSQVTGYQIQYATNSKFSKAKTVTLNKNSYTSKKVSKLSAKKKYYVRIRTYKTVNGNKYYSSWSKAKSVTTKK